MIYVWRELDMPGYEDYEAEQERRRRLRKRLAHIYGDEEREDGEDEYAI